MAGFLHAGTDIADMYRTVSMAVQLWHISTLARRMQVSMWVNVVIPVKNGARYIGEAVASGDVSRLAGLLREDAVAVTDGGGRKTAALHPIMGADKIARFFIALAAKNTSRDIRIEPAVINGTAGALLYIDGEVDQTLSMASEGDLITAIYIERNPDKQRHVPSTARR